MSAPTEASNHDLGERILSVLRGPLYQKAREAILRYETIERQRATSAITELRDALDHMWYAAQSNDAAEVASRVQQMGEHLRRAAVEPAQDMVESRLADIYQSLRFYEWKRLIHPGLPPRSEVNDQLKEIKRRLENGRVLKGRMENFETALEDFYNAHIDAANLHERLAGRPLRTAVVIGVWLVPFAVGVAGLIAGIIAIA